MIVVREVCIMVVQTITAADFADGRRHGFVNARYECLRCGYICYYVDPFTTVSDDIDDIFAALPSWIPPSQSAICCRRCEGDAVRVADCMSEIAVLFAQCGYDVIYADAEIQSRHVSHSREAERLRVFVMFRGAYPQEMFQDLPDDFIFSYARADGETLCDLMFEYSDYDLLSKFEKDLVLDDALSTLHAWVSELHTSKAYLVYALAGLL